MRKFQHGDRVKEIVTGRKGIITGYCDYLTGCEQFLVTPENAKDEQKWVDADRLALIKSKAVKLPKLEHPGPDLMAPIR